MDLKDAVVVVTGGSKGIGKAIAAAFCASGAKVAIASRSKHQVEETVSSLSEAGGTALGKAVDISDAEQVEALFSDVESSFGPIDILVNNAGSYTAVGPTWDVDAASWSGDIRVNLLGTYLCSAAALRSMVKRKTGYVIVMTGGGADGPIPYGSAYGTTKLALLGFAEALAIEAKPHGINVFVTDPGFVQTDMTRSIASSQSGRECIPFVAHMIDEGKGNPPELCAELILKLTSGKVDILSGCYFSAEDDFDDIVLRAPEIVRDGLYKTRIKR